MVIVLAFQLEVLKYEATAGPQLACIAGGGGGGLGISGKNSERRKKFRIFHCIRRIQPDFPNMLILQKLGGGGGRLTNSTRPSLRPQAKNNMKMSAYCISCRSKHVE